MEKRLEKIVPVMKKMQAQTGVKLLWGTANLFSNPRYMNGAALILILLLSQMQLFSLKMLLLQLLN